MEFKKRYLLALIPLIVVGIIFYYFSDIITYVVLAWVLSMIGAPIVRLLKRWVGRTFAAVITLIIFLLGMFLLVYVFVPPLVTQARNLAGVDYENVIKGLEEPIKDWELWLIEKGIIDDTSESSNDIGLIKKEQEPVTISRSIRLDSILNGGGDTLTSTNISFIINIQNPGKDPLNGTNAEFKQTDDFFDRMKKSLYSFINPSIIPQLLTSVVGWVGNLLVAIMSILFIAFFFLREQGLFNNILSSFVPNEYEDQTIHAVGETSRLLIRYFTGILGQITVVTIFVSLILSLLGIKNALLIGFFAALMNVIPYIGPIIGATFGIIITLSSNLGIPFYDEMLPMLIKVMIVFGIMQLLDNFILQPNIFSKSVKAHPLEIFIVVLIGAKLGGIAGMVLAIPIYTVLRVIAKVFLSEFKVVQSITKSMGD
jgi:predicted PurR-regulated permease PerM